MRYAPLPLAALLATTLLLPPGDSNASDKALAEASEAAFVAADHDHSGTVSWEEFRNRVVAVFGHLDANEDGRLIGDEHPPAKDAKGESVQPGTVTAESFTASIAEAFKKADRDGDGELSKVEWLGNDA